MIHKRYYEERKFNRWYMSNKYKYIIISIEKTKKGFIKIIYKDGIKKDDKIKR